MTMNPGREHDMVSEFDECGVFTNLGITLSVKNDCAHLLGSVCHERKLKWEVGRDSRNRRKSKDEEIQERSRKDKLEKVNTLELKEMNQIREERGEEWKSLLSHTVELVHKIIEILLHRIVTDSNVCVLVQSGLRAVNCLHMTLTRQESVDNSLTTVSRKWWERRNLSWTAERNVFLFSSGDFFLLP